MKGEDLEGYFSVENGTDDTAHQSSASPAALDEDMVTEERWTDQSALLVVDEDIPVDGTKSKKA